MRTRTLALFALAVLAASSAATADLPAQAQGATALDALQRAELMVAHQSWDAAIAAYAEAIAASPSDAALRNRLGICYQRKGDAKAARAAYKKALDLRKDYPEAWNNLGTLDHARGKYKQAISAYSKAVKLNPKDAVVHKNLGAAWLARGDMDKALEAWTEAFRLDPATFRERCDQGQGGRRDHGSAVLPLRQAARRSRRDREGARVPGEGARGGLPRLRGRSRATATSPRSSPTRATRH